MKLASEVSVVERSGDFSESAFSIEMNSKAFYVLSAQLYSNKIQAVIRELSTNAYDAQVFSNSKKPFEVHLPTIWEPEFSVRDYGPGLSEEDVKNLYTTYFKSNKINSNDFVGCLGLGSKSPFAYTDSFTVTSWFNGECKQYTMYLDENKFPRCALLTCNQSDEPTGLKVSLSVKNNDISSFMKEAKRVYSFFKNQPKQVGASINLVNINGEIDGNGWKFGIPNDFGSSAFAVMGNIAYSINNAATHMPAHLRNLCIAPVVIYVNIGDVEPSPNREELSYTKETIKAIKDKLELVSNELLKNVQLKVSECKNLWDARMKCEQLRLSGAFNYIDSNKVSWNGNAVNSNRLSFNGNEFSITQYNCRNYKKIEKYSAQTFTMKEDSEFYWLDDEKCRKNLIHYVKSSANSKHSYYNKAVYLIERGTQRDYKTNIETKANTTKSDFEKQLGKEILTISSLPKAPSAARGPKDKYKMLVANLKSESSSNLTDSINKGEFYLYLNRNGELAKGDDYQVYWLSQKSLYSIIKDWNHINPNKKIEKRVLLLKHHQDQNKVKKYGLKNVYDFMKEELQDYINTNDNKNLIENFNYFVTYEYNNYLQSNIFSLISDDDFKGFKSDNLSDLSKQIQPYSAVAKHAVFINKCFCSLSSTTKKPTIDLQPVLDEYPMLSLVFEKYNNFRTWSKENKQIVFKYIQ